MNIDDDMLNKIPLVVQFLREQHKTMTKEQVKKTTMLTLLLITNGYTIEEDTSVALRAMADYNDFCIGMNKK